MKLSVRTLHIIFAFSFLALVAAFFYSYVSIQRLRNATEWVEHTNKVLLHLERIHLDLKDAESGVRGYIISGDPSHLEPYYGAHKDIRNQLDKLSDLIADNPSQLLRMDTLRTFTKDRFVIFNRIINLSNSHADPEEVARTISEGKNIMDRINQVMEDLKLHEQDLLETRNAHAQQLNRSTPTLIVLCGLLGFLILGASYIFIIRDFQLRIGIGKELKKKNTLLEYAQQITKMGTFEYDIPANKNIWSDELYDIFELPKDSTPDFATIDSLILEDKTAIEQRRQEIFSSKEGYSHEFKIRTPKGTEKILLSNGYVTTDNHHHPIALTGAIIDITALKTAEMNALEKEQLMKQAKEKAESASQFKTRFLSNMSHEIRTPINAILGFTRILNKQNFSKEHKEYLKNISVSGELLLKLIGNILDISKIEEGKVVIETKSFNLKENIRSVLSPFKYTASEKGLNFHLQIDESIPDYIMGDAARISQVMINLIGNAIKFTSQGDITVAVHLAGTQDDYYLIEFSVTDTGIGIAPEKQSEIFESFTQADESIQVQYGGSGLGLSIVREVVHLMGGNIQIKSPVFQINQSEGYGSKFYFTLPMKVSDYVSSFASRHVEIIPFPKKVHVLVAEDNEMNQTLAAYTLDSLGCSYDIVENGEHAVRIVAEKTFDIILMDVQMPVCDGMQATKRIRENNTGIPIIGLTANVFQQEVDACLEAGMNAHMGKPYTEEQLFAMIEEWVFHHTLKKEEHTVQHSDFSFIENLSRNNMAVYREMLEVFQNQNHQLLHDINTALENSDLTSVSFSLHQYKSCVRILGIKKQIDTIAELEKKIKAGYTLDALASQIQELLSTGQTVDEEIKSKLQTLHS